MKRILALLLLLLAGPALAADNYAATEGAGKTFRCVDVGGVCYPVFGLANTTGNLWLYGNGATGTGSPRVTISNDNTIPTGWPTAAGIAAINTTLGSPFQAGGSIGNTSFAATQGTSPWVSSISTWAGGTLGAMTNYGTAPSAVLVPNVNAFVTNAPVTGRAAPSASSPVVLPATPYETVAASQTAQALGATGATGDYLSHCVIYPVTTSPGVVTVFDNASAAGANVIAFAGGATSVSNLTPISVPVGSISTAGAWKVTTGANVIVTCYGNFT